ncbi:MULTISPECIES: hypothetical protein [unclassified Pseudomonas]|uniref:hypothetical protein n=1 Tax=unclassified Pseudomonas TaxID=196821 RepID=UPI0015624B22|nr:MULTISPECIES: hypothetical protein [unclassified Pseudomonas]
MGIEALNLSALARKAGNENYAEAAAKAANTKAYQRAADTALANLQGVKYASQSQGGGRLRWAGHLWLRRRQAPQGRKRVLKTNSPC